MTSRFPPVKETLDLYDTVPCDIQITISQLSRFLVVQGATGTGVALVHGLYVACEALTIKFSAFVIQVLHAPEGTLQDTGR